MERCGIVSCRDVKRCEIVYDSPKYGGFYGLFSGKLEASVAITEWLIKKKYGTLDGHGKARIRLAMCLNNYLKGERDRWEDRVRRLRRIDDGRPPTVVSWALNKIIEDGETKYGWSRFDMEEGA